MPFLDMAFANDYQEPQTAPDGEYKLEIISAKQKTSKSGNPMLEVRFRNLTAHEQGVTNAMLITDYIMLAAHPDPQVANMWAGRLKEFCQAAQLDPAAQIETVQDSVDDNGNAVYDVPSLKGIEVFAFLGTESNEEYGNKNKISRYSTSQG